MCQHSKLFPICQKKYYKASIYSIGKMTKNGAKNEGIFVPNPKSFALVKCPLPWRRHLATIKRVILRLGEPEAFYLQDSPLCLGKGPLRLGEGLHLVKPEAFDFFILASPWRSNASGASFTFFLFLPSSLLALLSISTKLTQMRD